MTPFSGIYRSIDEISEILKEMAKSHTMDSTSSIGNKIGEANSSISGNRAGTTTQGVGGRRF